MTHRILIIDDEKIQTTNLKRAIENDNSEIYVDTANSEEEIKKKIADTYYNIAVVDLRMDDFSLNGFDIINEIIGVNPFARIIICSAYLNEYSDQLNSIIASGKIAAILDKEKFDVFSKKIINNIRVIIDEFEANEDISKAALEHLYSDAKNETNPIKKGKKFEYFVTTLFSQIGFTHIMVRNRDKSFNEVDLIMRNELNDIFFKKFKPYLLVECKNEMTDVDKNQFITFYSKLEHTNGMANLGFIITPKGFKRTTYLEAIRTSNKDFKVVFLSNNEIEELIRYTESPISVLKKIIDSQVKDN